MRVRTDARRNAIVASAWEIFRETGFERARMSDIAARADASKATLYGYFPSKQDLFTAAVDFALQPASDSVFKQLSASGPLEVRLKRFGTAHLEIRLSADMLAVDRIMAAEAETTYIYEAFGERSRKRRQDIADVLAAEMAEGNLRQADPLRAAIHLLALIEFDVRDRRLFGDTSITTADVKSHLRHAIDAFLQAYAAR